MALPTLTWRRKSLVDHRPPYKPCCSMAETPGRVSLSPLVRLRYVGDVKVYRQSLSTLRSCCLEDPLRRAEWWERVESTLDWWWKSRNSDCAVERYDLAASRRILAGLDEVVPRPNQEELEEYFIFKQAREREIEKSLAPLKAALLSHWGLEP